MNTISTIREVQKYDDVCKPAIRWLRSLPNDANPWEICKRGDWLLWFAERRGIDLKLIVTADCKCARLVLPFVLGGELRPLHAIETTEAWIRGEATLEQVKAAAAATRAAIYAAIYAGYSADAAAIYAGYSAAAAANTAAYSDTAAAAAIYAGYSAAAAKATGRTKTLKQCADIVREIIPTID